MICVVTKNETTRLYSGIPLSREGLAQVRDYQERVKTLSKETGLPFTMTTKMAIDDLKNGRDLVKKYREKLKDNNASATTVDSEHPESQRG